MDRINLNGDWTLHFGPQAEPAANLQQPRVPEGWQSVSARVPGNVELDLIRAGLLPKNLDRGHHIYELRTLEGHQWRYSRNFELSEPWVDQSCELVLEGVDTVASVWLNGTRLADLENMLIPHRIDVSDICRAGDNEIVVVIDSTVLTAARRPVEPGSWAMENNWESLSIRKAAHSFGWDIMPRVVSAGLWRNVYLEPTPQIRFRGVYLATPTVDAAQRAANLIVRWDLETDCWPVDDWSVQLTVDEQGGGRRVFEKQAPVLSPHGEFQCVLQDVDLWWPRGFGRASLYDVNLQVRDDAGEIVAAWSSEYGFRTIRLEKTPITTAAADGEFAFSVNGEKVFIKGTNWVPLDALHSRDAERLDETFDMLVDLNCNMIRCWGGNVYEAEAFYRRADRAGVMVWQDFAFACALYPQTSEFHAKVRQEAEAIIPQLRNHPALALWAGNNEIDAFYTSHKPHCDPNVDDQISREVLATACRRLDPYRDYLPSSPYYSPELWALGAPLEARPEDHLWGPRDDFKGPYYVSSNAHFVSEIGYHGCPDRTSLERMMTPDQLWPWQNNEQWLTHAVRPQPRGTAYNYRIPLMAHQIAVLFGSTPDDLDDFVFASQVSQAEALKFFIERFRIGKGRRSGILWWNLRDGWPQISDAIVDYYGARKIAYPVIRRLQADVCVMIDEPQNDKHSIVAVNDTRQPAVAVLTVRSGGKLLFDEETLIPANGKQIVGEIPASPVQAFYDIQWRHEHSEGRNHYLAGPRPFNVEQCQQWYHEAGLAGAAVRAVENAHAG